VLIFNLSSGGARDKIEALGFCFQPLSGYVLHHGKQRPRAFLLFRRCFDIAARVACCAFLERMAGERPRLIGELLPLRRGYAGSIPDRNFKASSRCRLPIDKTTRPVRAAIEKTDCLPNQPGKVSSVFVSDWSREGDQVDTSAFLTDSQPYGNSRHLETNKECWERIEGICLSTLGKF
jgi:hypothetical protein